ncbi:uncharacterized protein SRS1_15551 [Sporisorium reilianum f. sp. reilianum]|uniref:Uncharacterized protein n=1 Tax=Sporisorium reilianum f. sp. reilianum TaxID=72559 RepID=A0A2N8UIE2_9BASI|nr:uncharacterized protein SRS1_15551 [Sporisorium reilianum f. sp. reilianum]
MNPYSSGARDNYRSADPRGRSRSPPPSRNYQEREAPRARIVRDHDAPSKSLPRKPVTSTNALPVNASGSFSHNYPSTSASATTLDRNASTSRAEPSASRRTSGAAAAAAVGNGAPADLAELLYASRPDFQLFEQLQTKNWTIIQDRLELERQQQKLEGIKRYVETRGADDARSPAMLADQHQKIANQEQKIRSGTQEFWRMQVVLNVQMMTALMASPFAQLESKLQAVSQEAKAERENDRKAHEDLQKSAYTHFGQINRFQSDISKSKGDLSALNKDVDRLRSECKDMRKDLDADVVKITDNRERVKRLETDVAALQDKAARSFAGPSSAAIASAASPVQDPRQRPAPQPSAASASASSAAAPSAAATSQSTTQNPAAAAAAAPPPPTASASAPASEPVTRAQFRKWVRDHDQDLEVRFEEVVELAVQEATAENRACMDQRIRALARNWKSRVLQGEDASTDQDQAASNADIGDPPSGAAAAATDGDVPMDVETEQQQQQQQQQQQSQAPPAAAITNGVQPTQANVAPPSTSTQSQPASASATAVSAPTATSSASDAPKDDTPSIAPATMSEASSAAKPAVTSPATPPVDGAGQPRVVKQNGTDKQFAVIPVEALAAIRTTLKEHETQLAAVQQKLDALASLESESFAKLLESPEKIKQLLEALRRNGLSDVATDVGDALAQLRSDLDGIRTELGAVRASHQAQQQVQEEFRPQMIALLNEKVEGLQRQYEMLDDQSSLQGALLVKLVEHANPRRSPPSPANSVSGGAAQASPGVQSPAVRSPPIQNAQRAQAAPVAQPGAPHVSTLPNTMMRPASGVDAAATALSAHVQPQVYVTPQQAVHSVQAYQQAQHPQAQAQVHPQQHAAYAVPRGAPYAYQDPNQRQGYR